MVLAVCVTDEMKCLYVTEFHSLRYGYLVTLSKYSFRSNWIAMADPDKNGTGGVVLFLAFF